MAGQQRNELAVGTRLAIIRHGEALCNVESFIGGHEGCKGLTERGVRQVEVLAARLVRTGELAKCAGVYTSILPRARQSARIIADALGVTNVVERCELCERHPGIADGLTWAEYEERYQRVSLPGDDPTLPLSEGGESWIEFLDRAEASLLEVVAAHPGELSVVVAHGGIIDASMVRFFGLHDHGAAVRLHPEHSSITEWECIGQRWRLVRYNDAAHLDDTSEVDLRAPLPDWVHMDRVGIQRVGR